MLIGGVEVDERALADVCRRYGLAELSIFGSRARGDAVLWRFTKLGEAASQLSAELRERHGEVLWRDPIAFRNRIVHGYFDVDDEIVDDAAVLDMPRLLEAARGVLRGEFPGYHPDG